jgi:hypothetical protein
MGIKFDTGNSNPTSMICTIQLINFKKTGSIYFIKYKQNTKRKHLRYAMNIIDTSKQ